MANDTQNRPPNMPERSPHRPPVWAFAWLTTLVVLTISVYAVDPTGWLGSDDSAYYNAAEQILHGDKITRVHHHNARMAVIVPIALSLKLFGESPAAVILPTTIASILCVLMIAWLGRLLWGWWEGLLAGTVLAVLPYFRIVATTAYPDAHACMWSVLAVLLVVLASQRVRFGHAAWLVFFAALCTGMAASAKLFAIAIGVPIVMMIWSATRLSKRERGVLFAVLGLGGAVFFIAHGMFYVWAADDFWFKLHAVQNIQRQELYFPREGLFGGAGLGGLILDRFCLLFRIGTSGWGWWGLMFWPLTLTAFLTKGAPRMLSVWALIAYLLIAFTPASLRFGYHPPPIFDGRNLLPASIPFALLLGWFTHRGLALALSPAALHRAWPVGVVLTALVSFSNPNELNGFRRRHTQRLTRAVEQLVASHDWTIEHDIVMSPSLYLRYRILFPPELRSRLRVAVDDDAPTWWRNASWDVMARREPLPSPGHAYLIATPRQLTGEPEAEDYGVTLPRHQLGPWRNAEPVVSIHRFPNRSIVAASSATSGGKLMLMLLASRPVRTAAVTPPLSLAHD